MTPTPDSIPADRLAAALAALRAGDPEGLATACQDEHWLVRAFAAAYLPIDQIGWAVTDPDQHVRSWAAARLPIDQIEWATTDPDALIQGIEAHRRATGRVYESPTIA
jgi:hypothetical protein